MAPDRAQNPGSTGGVSTRGAQLLRQRAERPDAKRFSHVWRINTLQMNEETTEFPAKLRCDAQFYLTLL